MANATIRGAVSIHGHQSAVPHRKARARTHLRIALLERALLCALGCHPPPARRGPAPRRRSHRPATSVPLPLPPPEAPPDPARTSHRRRLPRSQGVQVPPRARGVLCAAHVRVERDLRAARTDAGGLQQAEVEGCRRGV
ncbi:hypothetical protein L1887_51960 [Cichorium endivia]|nr:hypothetical protein L1887_51960 [Cichorium endivia]